MATEDVDPRFADLDAWALASAMEAMWEGKLAAVAAIGRALPAITAATTAAEQALGDRGRLIYIGAGTSARVAVQDGAETQISLLLSTTLPEACSGFIPSGVVAPRTC